MGIGNIATSGMQAAMTNMEVISNNISNANTMAFKSSYANFADLYPNGSASSVQPGLGVSVTSVKQNFATGGPIQTSRPEDLAITNQGFFIYRDAASGQTSYSRYGSLTFSNGYLMVGNGRLQGYAAVNGSVPSGSTATDLFISTSAMAAKATSTVTQQSLNLNASDSLPATGVFATNDPTSYNFSSTSTIYDSLGATNTLQLYYVKTSANHWTVNVYVNNTSVGSGTLVFNGANGALSSTAGLGALSFNPTSGATSPQTFAISMTGATQYSQGYNAKPFTSDGYQAGNYIDFSIDENGKVTVNYDNKQQLVAGQIALALFQSPEGLQNIGNMSWYATTASGSPTITQENSQNAIRQSSLEMSNVDLASEMVNLMSAQNIFQANAQVEQTYNQVMQTVNKLA